MKYVVYILLMLEVGAAVYWYAISPQGYIAYRDMKASCQELQTSMAAVDRDIRDLRATYDMWEHDPFWYEQYARTQLHMGYPHEQIYILDT